MITPHNNVPALTRRPRFPLGGLGEFVYPRSSYLHFQYWLKPCSYTGLRQTVKIL